MFRSFLSYILIVFTFNVASAQKIYSVDWKQETIIFGTSSALAMGSLAFEKNKKPINEEYILGLDRNDIIGFDRATTFNYSGRKGLYSDYFKNLAYLAPISLLASKQLRENRLAFAIMYAEVLVFNGSLNYFVKSAVGRVRPYAYNTDVSLDVKLRKTTRRSFYSGHTSHVSSMCFFAASVFDDLYPESDYKYLVWGAAISAPAITGYLRYKAGVHFPTDVVIGYGVGAAVGILIPKLHKINVGNSNAKLSIVGNRIALNVPLH